MEISESINNLTTEERTSDIFNTKHKESPIRIDVITDTIRHNISIVDFSAVEEGRAFYKQDTQTERAVVKNFLLLYNDTLIKAVQQSNITEDYKSTIQKSISFNIASIQANLDAIGNITNVLNKQKNILDAKRISFIMLGYAIAIIKKIYHI